MREQNDVKRALTMLQLAVEDLEQLSDIGKSQLSVDEKLAFEFNTLYLRLRGKLQDFTIGIPELKTECNIEDGSCVGAEKEERVGQRGLLSNFKSVEDLRTAFDTADVNGDGQLDLDELHDVFAACGKGFFTASVIRDFIDDFDRDGSGNINFAEFLKVWNSSSTHPVMMQAMKDGVEELSKETKKFRDKPSAFVLHPQAPVNAQWELFVTALLIITVVILPLSIAFERLGCKLRWVNLLIDFGFLFDIMKQFNTGFIAEDGAIVLSRCKIIRRYVKRGFLVDFVSSVPYDLVHFTAQCSNSGRYVQASRLLKVVRVSRIMKVFRLLRFSKTFMKFRIFLMDYEDKYHISIPEAAIKMTQLLLLLLLGAHWIGCLQFLVVAEASFPRDSWVYSAQLHDAPVQRQYLWSYYKALAQMVMIGFEVPAAVNQSCNTVSGWCALEHWLTLLCLYLGAVFYSILISNISMILASTNVGSRKYQERLQHVQEYMKSKGLPAILRDKVKDFYSVKYTECKIFDEEKILSELAPTLRQEIIMYNTRELIEKVPLLANVSDTFKFAVAARLIHRVCLEGNDVIKENTTGDSVYFILSGIFDILHEGNIVETIADGCYFGDCAAVLNCRRTATVSASVVSVTYELSKKGFIEALALAPEDVAAYVTLVARSRFERMQKYKSAEAEGQQDSSKVAYETLLHDHEDTRTHLYKESLRQHIERSEIASKLGDVKITTLTPERVVDKVLNRVSAVFRGCSSGSMNKIHSADEDHSSGVSTANLTSSPIKQQQQQQQQHHDGIYSNIKLCTEERRNSGARESFGAQSQRHSNLAVQFQAPDRNQLPIRLARLRARRLKKTAEERMCDRYDESRNLKLFRRTLLTKDSLQYPERGGDDSSSRVQLVSKEDWTSRNRRPTTLIPENGRRMKSTVRNDD